MGTVLGITNVVREKREDLRTEKQEDKLTVIKGEKIKIKEKEY